MAEQPILYSGTAENMLFSPSTAAGQVDVPMPPASGRSDPGLTTHRHGPRSSSRAFPQPWYRYKQTDGHHMYSSFPDIPKANEPYLCPPPKPVSSLRPLPRPVSILCKQRSDREEVGQTSNISLVFTHLVPASFKVAIKICITRLRSLGKLTPRATYIWHPPEKSNCLCFILTVCSPHCTEDLSPCPSEATLVADPIKLYLYHGRAWVFSFLEGIKSVLIKWFSSN